MDSDALLLARIQFGFTISFHIIFPAITIGLASYLAVLEGLWLRTRATVYRDLYHFWTKIFAVNFGMGVVSGLVMAYQFGTNWSFFSDFAGSITGPLLAYEVLTAFFLEAGFLGVMLFGWSRVGPGLHFFHGDGGAGHAGVGHLDPGVQQLDADAGRLRDRQRPGRAHGLAGGDLQSVLPYRLAHMGIAAFLATALMVGASGAWHLLRGDRSPAVKKMFAMAMGMLLLVAPLQAVVGDVHGLNTLKHQPAKVAAMEGHWENEPGAGVPLTLFGLPDMDKEETRYALNIPRLGSLILTHSWDGQFPGLKSYPAADRPNVPVVFWSFRVMVGLGLLMIALAIWALWTLARPAVRIPRAATLRAVDGTLWTDRHAGRLVCHRSGPPALGGVRRDAHGRCGHAARVGRADADAGAFRGGIPAGVRRRRVLHAAPDPHGSHARPRPRPIVRRTRRTAPAVAPLSAASTGAGLPPQTSHSGA